MFCCDEVIGGKILLQAEFSNNRGTKNYEALGEVRIQPAGVERTAGASSNGKVWAVEAARPARVIMSFVNRCGFNPLELYCERCKVTVTVYEKSRGFLHMFIDSIIVGSPEVNLSTGEISGMEIVSDDYKTHPMGEEEGECNIVPPGSLSGISVGGGAPGSVA